MFAAILDTCVLWPNLQRDFLLSMAVEGLYRPLWSEAIFDELHRHEYLKWVDREMSTVAAEKADRLIENMRRAFDDALVTGWEPLVGTYGLPDPDDEHVVAAAEIGGAGAIVTENLKDFPLDEVPSHIQVITAPEFAANTADVDPARAAAALHQIAARHKNPPGTAAELLATLVDRYQMKDVGDILAPHI